MALSPKLTRSVPSNLFLNKVGKPAAYLPTVMIIWGVISAATAAADSFGGLLAIRFTLGFVEAAYFVSLSCEVEQVRLLTGNSRDAYFFYRLGIPGKNLVSGRHCSILALSCQVPFQV